MQQILPESAVHHIALAVRIRSAIDVATLHSALQAIADRHDSLRTVFAIGENAELIQSVQSTSPVAFETIDTSRLSAGEIDALVTGAYRRPFDLAAGPLFRSHLFTEGAGNHILLVAAHHLVFDALSLVVVFNELLELYSAARSGRKDSLLPVKAGYRDFVAWQTQMLAGPEGEAHLAFWREQLEGAPPVLDLPIDRPRPVHPRGRGGSVWFPIADELMQRLKTLSSSADVYPFDIFSAAWQVLLHRYTGQTDIAVGFVTAGRPHLRYARTTGLFSNVIVQRARFEDDPSFERFLRTQHERLAQGLNHQDYPFAALVEKLQPARLPGYMPLTQALFNYFMSRSSQLSELFVRGYEPAVVKSEAFDMESYGLEIQEDLEFDLMLDVAEGKCCWGRIRFDADLFDNTTVERLSAHYLNVLRAVAADPARNVSSIPLLGDTERRELLNRWNRIGSSSSAEATVYELFEAQAAATPDRIAAVFADRQITYAELHRRAGSLAAYLRHKGLSRGSLVAICVERSLDMLVAPLAVWKAGAAYVPLDPHFPKARIDLILEDAAPHAIITQSALLNLFPLRGESAVTLDSGEDKWSAMPAAEAGAAASGSDLAYVIYTSGSTGTPKGVEIAHSAFGNFLQSMRRRPGLGERDVLLAVTTFSFDIAGLELFLPLVVGATVAIAASSTTTDGRQLAQDIESRGVTAMQATPATWRLLLDAGWRGCARMKALCGGEAWPRELAAELLPRVASLWNMYGPTETTVWSAIHEVRPGEDSIPLGEPIDNTSLYILDSHLQPVPHGVAGELHIGGAGLARGYRNRPELTASRFIPDPSCSGERLYKTGDLCRCREDKGILFLGRLDDQVKLHGHRIELGEIESVLLRHPAVQQAAVVMNDRPGSGKRLIAYLAATANDPALIGELRDFLAAQLPRYMIPSAFVPVESLPLTPNSKIDRKALSAMAVPSATEERAYRAPRTPTEAAIAELWAQALTTPPAGVHSRFDEMGGDSLSFALMTIRAGNKLGKKIPVRMDPETLSVEGFARFVDSIPPETPVAAPSARREQGARGWLGRILVGACSVIVRCLVRIEANGLENMPDRGPAIVASNHISLFDLAILGAALSSLRPRVPLTPVFIIFDKWRWLARPYVSQFGDAIYIRRGEGDMEALAAAKEVLANRGMIAITPEGRPTRGALARAKPGVAYLALETGAPVWPLAVFGHDRAFCFWKRLRRVPVTIRLGRRLDLNRRGQPDFQRQADSVMLAIAGLMPPEYHGAYAEAMNSRQETAPF